MLALIVGSDFLEGFGEDFESELGFFSVEGVELGVNFSGGGLIEFTNTVEEASVLDIEMSIGQTDGEESEDKEYF